MLFARKNTGHNLGEKTLEHQPTVWPVPYACAQPYQPGSGSHGGDWNGLNRVHYVWVIYQV